MVHHTGRERSSDGHTRSTYHRTVDEHIERDHEPVELRERARDVVACALHDDSEEGVQKLSAGSAGPLEEEKAMPSASPPAAEATSPPRDAPPPT
jgi:hypothetical protein